MGGLQFTLFKINTDNFNYGTIYFVTNREKLTIEY